MTVPTVVPHRPRTASQSGLAQHTLVEHALCPLDPEAALRAGGLHVVRYEFTDRHRNRRWATAQVASAFGLSAHDEFYLYGLLAQTFSQPEPSPDFYATPHWCLRQLGLADAGPLQGKRYALFRAALRRLAGVVYQNDHFYDPVRGEHRQVTFGLLKYSLPLDPASSRAWHIVWDAQFFRFCQALRGSFAFDLTMYRSLDPASRRLFLLLQKIFWRNDHTPAFELRQLGVNVLGFAASLRTAEIKQKLIRSVRVLQEQGIVALPPGVDDVSELFTKRSKGVHEVAFHRGPYFDRASATAGNAESPLAGPLESIGFAPAHVRQILRDYPARLVQEWSDITLAAVERRLIKQSPQAYFLHYIREAAAKKTTPPDWWRELRKQELRRQHAAAQEAEAQDDQRAFDDYLRSEAAQAFEAVMQRVFESLRQAGQGEPEARRNADHIARTQFRARFRRERGLRD